ncbi:DUF1353 domain-containing protein [Aliarcobacter butzleri]|jgi:hypothetical protein|uniref:DUF1353 domain-containing protein n=1 Tax=Aliarcobacter butzleri TaxID=28197 RepID=A0AAW6VQA6_9BACT|nr:DUF1353 domain-containing protein [Aliarcobacter butzleri]MDK2062782.1 DUF1353 domain-containing protein [Aliarcobacter butzleri]
MIYPLFQPNKNNRLILLENYNYENIEVPKGFETNGADIPRIFWIIVPPFKPKYLPAVLVHDYLIKIAKNKQEIFYANYYFEKILLEIENSFKTRAMIKAVNLYWKIR